MGDACDCCCNVIWFIFGGFQMCIIWCITGAILCCTICGIPIGLQCFKIGCFALCPFGKDIVHKDDSLSCCYCFLNVIWILTGGLFLCIMEGFIGVIYCITICGIPFGLQHFKLARLALMPFGADVVEKDALANAGGVIVQPPPVVVVQQGYTPPVQPYTPPPAYY